ncbi:SCP2 sterol-binding domain-containing protein [Jannaschia seohaensis]|uniref:SCP-2 sterol transfer family protein n=1 Tax=Jannaschia seohaensis TaxID=475081 RepID=A0A2Y9AE31_9RHOB|nr:SCP2 sterol-binding domain-containing protein [Jannaschia seohaensis]PWJ21108.1 SCP-2 sterol transfer family protein [Jannaschia seohaensis]SSA41518.1 SCP-2 sterol transfer family protein [Jannaschia seohaensis]
MSDIVTEAVTQLSQKIGTFDGSVKFVIEDEGAVMVDQDGVRASDEEADCTMTADAETFQGILAGEVNPTAAFMSGRLKVDGDMGVAMKLGGALS